MKEMDSKELADLLLLAENFLVREALKDPVPDRQEKLFELMPCLRDVASHYAGAWFVGQCFETVKSALAEREERLKIMKQRMDFLQEFQASLDPIMVRGEPLPLPHYALYSKTSTGSSVAAGNYLAASSLDDFWKIIDERGARDRYFTLGENDSVDSLKKLLEMVIYMNYKISTAESQHRDTAERLFGDNSGRLPFSPGEIVALQRVVESLE